MKELRFEEARLEQVDEVTEFVNGILEEENCPMNTLFEIDMAVEEIFLNIASYAYAPNAGPATVQVEVEKAPHAVGITFLDRGAPYDPLKKPDPDVTLPPENRQIGGLGIYMVKKTMDGMEYERRDGQNILRIRKNL